MVGLAYLAAAKILGSWEMKVVSSCQWHRARWLAGTPRELYGEHLGRMPSVK